jgi:hypothetical protein
VLKAPFQAGKSALALPPLSTSRTARHKAIESKTRPEKQSPPSRDPIHGILGAKAGLGLSLAGLSRVPELKIAEGGLPMAEKARPPKGGASFQALKTASAP